MVASITQILYQARSGMLARFLDLDVVSDNLANINTVGYKRGRANFQELLTGRRLGGVALRSTQWLLSQGDLRPSNHPLDLAIVGEGFFAVSLPDGRTAYTRDGQFRLDADRRIVTVNGYPLIWQGRVPDDAEAVRVEPDGTVMALQAGAWNAVGNIALTTFPNPSALARYGANLYLETERSGAGTAGTPGAEGRGQILGGYLEGSNVDLAEALTHLIRLQRAFEISVRTFQTTDEMLAQAIRMRGGG